MTKNLTKALEPRQFVHFSFYKVDPEWRRLPEEVKFRGKKEFASVIETFGERMTIRSYSLVGIRGDVDFMLWKISDRLEGLQSMGAELLSTGLGKYLHVPHSYLGMTKESIYVKNHAHGQERRLRIEPGDAPYLFVYPFVKTREWYHLTMAARQGMMDEHIKIGHKYPSVKINTIYSFGLDDQEFVLAFESERPEDFLDLVMELRETEASRYTLRDTPIFTCIAKGLHQLLDALE